MKPSDGMRSILAALPLAVFSILTLPSHSPWMGENKIVLMILPQTFAASAQPIVPAADGTGTVVIPRGNHYDINGGTTSGNGANLFHSFTRFGVDAGQVVNFLTNPAIHHILTRVVGGEASTINGLISVSGGSSNLYIMNPAGIIFGAHARLDVPGSFMATTANSIGIDSGSFNATGVNNYATLIGTPNTFNFGPQSGVIINAGELAVSEGQNLTLLGGVVINTGKLLAPAGQITIAAVGGENVVRISQSGLLLSLEIPAGESGISNSNSASHPHSSTTNSPITPLSLPQLLTGGDLSHATGLNVNSDGQVVLTASGQTLPSTAGTTIATGEFNVTSGNIGGTVNILGTRVGLLGAKIDASGIFGGGNVRIGGDFRGLGSLPNAANTYIDRHTSIAANAISTGNGGRVIVWADNTTNFLGNITATGGLGGFVEISGKENLIFNGTVDTRGINGLGTLLLDPQNITIVDAETGQNDRDIAQGSIFSKDTNTEVFTISAKALENLASTTDVVLEATNDIIINPLASGKLNLAATTGSITFTADSDRNAVGSFSMNPGDTIITQGGKISISGVGITVGNINTNGGDINLASSIGEIRANQLSTVNLSANAGNITLTSGGNITVDSLFSEGKNAGGDINISSGKTIRTQVLSTSGDVAGDVMATAFDNLNTDRITTTGNSQGGEINLISRTGSLIAGRGENSPITNNNQESTSNKINAAATNGQSGNIFLNAAQNITTGDINTQGNGGGNVTLKGAGDLAVGAITSTNGDITLTGQEIDFTGGNNSLSSSGNLSLQPTNTNQNIAIGNSINQGKNTLDLTDVDLAAFQNGFGAITIGGNNSSGTIEIANGTTFRDPVTIQSSVNSGKVTATGNLLGIDNASITIKSDTDIKIGNVSTTGSAIRITSNQGNITAESLQSNGGDTVLKAVGNITVASINTATLENKLKTEYSITINGNDSITIYPIIDNIVGNGGNLTITTTGTLTIDRINTTGVKAGNVTLFAPNGISLGNVNATGSKVGGNITLNSNEIDFVGGKNSIISNGELFLQPTNQSQDITIGGTANTTAFDLTATELNAISNGFTGITIGRPDGTGAITIGETKTSEKTATTLDQSTTALSELIFSDPVLIQSPGNSGTIASKVPISGVDNATITLVGGSLNIGDITSQAGINIAATNGNITAGVISTRSENGSGGNISIRSAGGFQSGNVNAFGNKSGGDISIETTGTIATGIINSSSRLGSAGSNTINSQSDIEVSSIKASGVEGGNIDITTGGTFRVTSTFTDINQISASISAAGKNRAGSLSIQQKTAENSCQGICLTQPFMVGNPNINGTAGAITDGKYTISINRELPINFDLKTVGILQTSPASQTSPTSISSSTPNSSVSPIPILISAESPPDTINLSTKISTPNTETGKILAPAESVTASGNNNENFNGKSTVTINPVLPPENNPVIVTPSPSPVVDSQLTLATTRPVSVTNTKPEISHSNTLSQIDLTDLVSQIDQNLGREFEHYFGPNLTRKPLNVQNIRNTLSRITTMTGVKPAMIYVSAQPEQLELRLFLPDGKAVFKSIPVRRKIVLDVVNDFTNDIRNPRMQDYKVGAKKLYQWLIAPIQEELEANGIQTLVFSMDSGLRILPVAALYDGNQFLVEKYSLGLIPSLSLTDTNYVDIRGTEVLAMGASDFPASAAQSRLPAVPMELSGIVGKLWPGVSFLNEKFTLANLKAQRNQPQYQIIHLATHGEFQPGGAANSYIQFWDTRLRLNQLRDLKLYSPQVELLVLSACTTAVGDEDAELGFAGLAVQAGVKSALASLWYVSDAGTLGLMSEFYQQLRTAPIKAEALRQAQLGMLKGKVRLQDGRLHNSGSLQGVPLPAELVARGDKNLSHPYYWAAFTMIGSPW
jgi:filamentous hemagglutinin family protein